MNLRRGSPFFQLSQIGVYDPNLLSSLFPTSTAFPLILSLGFQDTWFPQDEAVAPSSPFLEEDEGGKKDSWLAELAGERLMAATSCRSLRESPFRIIPS